MTTTLLLPKPVSTNAMFKRSKTGRVYTSREYKLWKVSAAWAFHCQNWRGHITGPYMLHVVLSSVKRRGDCDNYLKAISDFLVSLGITSDDKHCEKATAEWGDAPEGMCRVILTPVQRKEVA